MHRHAVVPTCLLLLVVLLTPPPTALAGTGEPVVPVTRVFDATVGDRDLGQHRYQLSGEPGDFRVLSECEFKAGFAFVTVFRYEHSAREHWVNDCMVSLESTTDDDGTDHQVSGRATEGGFSVETGRGGRTHDLDCAWGFAYWHPQLRGRTRLINPQDGRLIEVSWSELGERTLQVGAGEIDVQAWELTDGEDVEITLYYDDQDRWVGLDSVRDERVVSYRPAPKDPLYPAK